MNETITSEVKAKRRDNQAIKLADGEWYSVFKAQTKVLENLERGDVVVVDYKLKGDFRNIQSLQISTDPQVPATNGSNGAAKPRYSGPKGYSEKAFPMRKDSPDRTIIRSVAAKLAVHNSQNANMKEVPTLQEQVFVARFWENYISGDADLDALLSGMDSSSILDDLDSGTLEIKNVIPDID